MYIYICTCMYIFICIHRGKEREGIMKGGFIGGCHMYIYIYRHRHRDTDVDTTTHCFFVGALLIL